MSTTRIEDKNLQYNAQYRVLVCTICRYAIQKSAIKSHLLRHKVYRGDRQRILNRVAQYDILEPQDVAVPAPGSAPIDGLRIVNGYSCSQANCGHLCASSKRMQRHWREDHGTSGLAWSDIQTIAHPVKLQAFFRGTRLKYFAVSGHGIMDVHEKGQGSSDPDESTAGNASSRKLSSLDTVPLISNSERKETSVQINLNAFSYFKHFLDTTISSLPTDTIVHPTARHWQGIVDHALHHEWLMYGILTLASCHLALAETSEKDKVSMNHASQSDAFSKHFVSQWQGRKVPANVKIEVDHAAKQITTLLRFARRSILAEPDTSTKLLTILQDCLEAAPEATVDLPDFGCNSFDVSQTSSISSAPSVPVEVVLGTLQKLPARISAALPRPQLSAFLALLSAISALIKSFCFAIMNPDPTHAWLAMTLWVKHIPEDFRKMIVRGDTASMVVVYYWVKLVMQQAEQVGCWWIRGQSKQLANDIRARLVIDEKVEAKALHELLEIGV